MSKLASYRRRADCERLDILNECDVNSEDSVKRQQGWSRPQKKLG